MQRDPQLTRGRACLACGALMLAAGAMTGCTMIKALAFYTAPTTEKVPPDFERLEGKSVLIYVWADRDILWDYPKIRLDLSAYVGAYLSKNVKKVTLIEPLRVEDAIERGSSLHADPIELGRQFNADMVIHLSIHQFSLRDPGMAHFYRGRLASSVVVHDLTRDPPERVPLRDVRVSVPDERAVGYTNIRPDQIRQATYDAFAVEVGKKFHEWERPLD